MPREEGAGLTEHTEARPIALHRAGKGEARAAQRGPQLPADPTNGNCLQGGRNLAQVPVFQSHVL